MMRWSICFAINFLSSCQNYRYFTERIARFMYRVFDRCWKCWKYDEFGSKFFPFFGKICRKFIFFSINHFERISAFEFRPLFYNFTRNHLSPPNNCPTNPLKNSTYYIILIFSFPLKIYELRYSMAYLQVKKLPNFNFFLSHLFIFLNEWISSSRLWEWSLCWR